MKIIKYLSAVALTVSLLAPLAGNAADSPEKKEAKPYPLKTCVVSDEKLGEMGKPFVFEYKGQEIKLCCKSCKKDFDKDPAKYLKKMEEARKKAATEKPAKPDGGHEGHTH